MSTAADYLQQRQQRINQHLEHVLSSLAAPQGKASLLAAMRYSALCGGKRLRPLLVYATGETLGAPLEHLDTAACAVELIHCFSLIHDDLPAMDNAPLRRGQPSCHLAFDEATAILAGDALQSLAFELLSKADITIPADQRLTMVATLAQASGHEGMAGGQFLDLMATGKHIDMDELHEMHTRKTGTLLNACFILGRQCATQELSAQQHTALNQVGQQLGLAFQIQDDILDVTATTEQLGKQQQTDQALQKKTYPQLVGLEKAQQISQDLFEQSLALLDTHYPQSPLQHIVQHISARTH